MKLQVQNQLNKCLCYDLLKYDSEKIKMMSWADFSNIEYQISTDVAT